MEQSQIKIPPRVRIVIGAEWVFRHWLLIWVILFTIFNLLPYLAPVFMKYGLDPLAQIIYTLYSFIGHQMAHRSFFFFGEQVSYTPDELPVSLLGDFIADSTALRDFVGNETFGWKIAWSDRLLSLFGAMLISTYAYIALHKHPNFKRLSTFWMIMLVTPLILDGTTHYISDFSGVTAGFRWDNAWFANLTFHAFPESFYVGDNWGSFNSILRLITGILFGISLMTWGLANSEVYFERNATVLAARLEHWRARQRGESSSADKNASASSTD